MPPIDIEFINIHHNFIGVKEEIKGLEEMPGNLRGSTPQHDGVISKESMVNGLNPFFKGETWNLSLLKESV